MSCSSGTPRAPGDLGLCPSRARSHGDSRGITGSGGQKLTARAWEHFPAHTTCSPLLCKAVLRPLSGATSASAARSIQNMPSPGGQDSGMADTSAKPGSVGGLGAASRRPPRGLPRGSPGAGLATRPAVSRDAAPGEPRGRAMPGRRDATRAPSVEELSVPAPPSPDIGARSRAR
jgi:hypothetical protein